MKTLLKITEAAEMLAISKHFARKLVREGKLQVVRIGRSVRVRTSDLERIIANGNLNEIKK